MGVFVQAGNILANDKSSNGNVLQEFCFQKIFPQCPQDHAVPEYIPFLLVGKSPMVWESVRSKPCGLGLKILGL